MRLDKQNPVEIPVMSVYLWWKWYGVCEERMDETIVMKQQVFGFDFGEKKIERLFCFTFVLHTHFRNDELNFSVF